MLNPAKVVLDKAEYRWFFERHYTAFAHLLILNTNFDVLAASPDHDASQKSEQDGLCEKFCRILGQLDDESRMRLYSVMTNVQNIPIARDNATYQLFVGALTVPAQVHQDRLVDEWQELHDEENDCTYFFNERTNESYWIKPPPLSSEWVELWCEDYQQYYFFNSTTHESTWERPGMRCTTDSTAQSRESKEQEEVIDTWMATARENLAANLTIDRPDSVSLRFRLLGDLPSLEPPRTSPPKWDKKLGPVSPKKRKKKQKKIKRNF